MMTVPVKAAFASTTGTAALVVELFSFPHDSRREDEGGDRWHGERGAEYARSPQGRCCDLEGDRLDLGRVDKTPGLTC
ncbi:MAG: hypothetical protein OEW88_11520, partial [Gammaproteobacteria bacterium]|nr:hypothetical protein [Gammaproteobacteria bacterium]